LALPLKFPWFSPKGMSEWIRWEFQPTYTHFGLWPIKKLNISEECFILRLLEINKRLPLFISCGIMPTYRSLSVYLSCIYTFILDCKQKQSIHKSKHALTDHNFYFMVIVIQWVSEETNKFQLSICRMSMVFLRID